MFVLTVCKLERDADFRGGVFLGLNVLPNRGILQDGLTCQPALTETHNSVKCYRNNLSMLCFLQKTRLKLMLFPGLVTLNM